MSRSQHIAIRTTWFSILGNVGLALIKAGAGYYGHSYALIADALESSSDILASFLVLFGLTYAARPADKNHPYGHGRAETLITFLVVGFLILSATLIAWQSIINIQTPHASPEPWTLFILAPLILWKEILYRLVIRKAKETQSSALKADAWHHRSDAITSVAAFVGISIALFSGPGFEHADDWAALVASGFILYNSYIILRPALGEMMDEHLYDELVNEIRTVAALVPGIKSTEKCFIRKSGMKYHVDLHAMVDAQITVKEGHDLAHQLKDTLRTEIPSIGHVLIHIEPFE